MECRDMIIVGEDDFNIINPLSFIKTYSELAADLNKMRLLLNSDDNGRVIGVQQTKTDDFSIFVGLLSCSGGHVLAKGRGFRMHVAQSGKS
jgi:hypothetical protein